MKVLRTLTVAIVSLFAFGSANAAYIVNTGSNASGTTWSFEPWQYFAGEFSISSAKSINSIEGYYANWANSRGVVTISIHNDGGNIPGGILFSQTHTLGENAPLDWYGVFGLGWDLGAGTYWVSFEPGQGVAGIHPGNAPNPLDEYGQHSNGIWQDYGQNYFDYLDVGIRIDATDGGAIPEPTSLALLGLGLAGLGALRRRKTY